MLTTLGCPGTPRPRRPINSWGVPELTLTVPVGSGTEALDPGIPQLRNFSTEEFLGSGVPGHPRVVSIQGWFLAGPKIEWRWLSHYSFRRVSYALFAPLCVRTFLGLQTDVWRPQISLIRFTQVTPMLRQNGVMSVTLRHRVILIRRGNPCTKYACGPK